MQQLKVGRLYVCIDRCYHIMAWLKQTNKDGGLSSAFSRPDCQTPSQTDKSPCLSRFPVFSFQMQNRWIFFLHFIDLCIMALSLLHHWEGAQHRRRACPGKGKAAWALCCLLFSLKKLMCCEISILSDSRYSNRGNQSAEEKGCLGQRRGKDDPKTAGAYQRVTQPAPLITQSPLSGKQHPTVSWLIKSTFSSQNFTPVTQISKLRNLPGEN